MNLSGQNKDKFECVRTRSTGERNSWSCPAEKCDIGGIQPYDPHVLVSEGGIQNGVSFTFKRALNMTVLCERSINLLLPSDNCVTACCKIEIVNFARRLYLYRVVIRRNSGDYIRKQRITKLL